MLCNSEYILKREENILLNIAWALGSAAYIADGGLVAPLMLIFISSTKNDADDYYSFRDEALVREV